MINDRGDVRNFILRRSEGRLFVEGFSKAKENLKIILKDLRLKERYEKRRITD